MAAQNRRWSSRRATRGRPSELSLPRPDRSDFRFLVVITISSVRVLRRPLESAQYASHAYQAELARLSAVSSMSRKGNCWDNAVVESFFATLKRELLDGQVFESREAARAAIFESTEVFYNRQRRHSTLAYLTPCEADQQARAA